MACAFHLLLHSSSAPRRCNTSQPEPRCQTGIPAIDRPSVLSRRPVAATPPSQPATHTGPGRHHASSHYKLTRIAATRLPSPTHNYCLCTSHSRPGNSVCLPSDRSPFFLDSPSLQHLPSPTHVSVSARLVFRRFVVVQSSSGLILCCIPGFPYIVSIYWYVTRVVQQFISTRKPARLSVFRM